MYSQPLGPLEKQMYDVHVLIRSVLITKNLSICRQRSAASRILGVHTARALENQLSSAILKVSCYCPNASSMPCLDKGAAK